MTARQARGNELFALILSVGKTASVWGEGSKAPLTLDRKPRSDQYGDRLPDGAVQRFGSTRLRHLGPVMALAWSPDGNLLASSSQDRTIRLWDAAGQQAEIASALARMGPKAKPALPLLTRALAEEPASLCEAAAQAVGALSPAGRPAVPRLVSLLRRKEDAVRQSVVESLKRLGPEAEAAVPALIVALRDRDSVVRSGAVDALARIGPRAKEAVSALIAVLRVKELGLRCGGPGGVEDRPGRRSQGGDSPGA